jgi:hypothetical protein
MRLASELRPAQGGGRNHPEGLTGAAQQAQYEAATKGHYRRADLFDQLPPGQNTSVL